jgi:hypothetical protein
MPATGPDRSRNTLTARGAGAGFGGFRHAPKLRVTTANNVIRNAGMLRVIRELYSSGNGDFDKNSGTADLRLSPGTGRGCWVKTTDLSA